MNQRVLTFLLSNSRPSRNNANIYDPTSRPYGDRLDQARHNDNQFTDAAPAWQQSGQRDEGQRGSYSPPRRRRPPAGAPPPGNYNPVNPRQRQRGYEMDRGANIYDPTNHPYKDRMEQARRNDNQFTDSGFPAGPWKQTPPRRPATNNRQQPINNYRPTRRRGQNIYDPTSRPYGDRLDQARHNDNQFTDASPAWQQQSSGYDEEDEDDAFYAGPDERREGNSSPTSLFDRLPKQRKTDYGPEQSFGSRGSQAEWQQNGFMNRERRRQEQDYYDDEGDYDDDEYY